MKKRILAVLVSLTLIVTACSPGNKIPTNTDVSNLGEWDFNIYASNSDVTGINIGTEFIVESKSDVTLDLLKSSITILPSVDFQVVENSSKEFVIKPDKELKSNEVYKIELKNESQKYDFSWAFQTKKELKVIGSIPGNLSTYVPINSGIEIMFTHKNIENISEVFQIEPKIEGKFTSNGYSTIFVPNALEKNTTYKVTIKAGAKVKDSDLTLSDDYTFSFTTEPVGDEMIMSINNIFSTFTTRQNQYIAAYVNNNATKYEYNVNVFSFKDSNSYLKDIKKYDEFYSFQDMYENLSKDKPAYLDLIDTFKATPIEVKYNYNDFYSFEMPKQLPPGYYLVEISYENYKSFAYIQVNDMMVYDSQFDKYHFIWVLDSKTNNAIKNANITLNDTFTGKTSDDGTATINYTNNTDSYTTYAKIEASGYSDFVLRNVRYFMPYMRDFNDKGILPNLPNYSELSNNYWKYMFTDRSTYLPTDKLNFYGYIKPKLSSNGSYKISLYSNINGSYLIETKNISTTNTGTFTDSFKWKNLTPGSYSILIEDNDTLVLSNSFNINEYTKPIYMVDSEFNKDFISAGDTIDFSLKSSFFDGTPVPGMEFNYYMYLGNTIEGKLKTDENGASSVALTPTYNTTSWRPINAQIEAYNTNAENYQISDYDFFTFFPKNKMIELTYNEETAVPEVLILAHELNTSKYGSSYDFSYENLRGTPLNIPIQVKVTETWYERKETGQIYDYINKVNRKTYESIVHNKVVENISINTIDGKYILKMPYVTDSESSFNVEVTYNEQNGNKIIENTSVNYFRMMQTDPNSYYYNIRFENDKYSYKLNESVKYYLDNDGRVDESANDKFIIMYLQDGLLKYEIKNDLSGDFAFIKEYIPDIVLQGVYVKDGMMHKTASYMNVNYDYSEKNIKIEITADKKDYAPGDTVNLKAYTTDANGNPYPADVNISIVDEAYFNLYSQNADMLGTIYSSVYGTGIISEYVSSDNNTNDLRYAGMAEKGGADSASNVRSNFEDTATFITLTTDSSGNGTTSFELPDNLTSWRITYQGVNNKMEATTGWININAKLPFQISTIISKYFITGDNPSISLRSFGDAAVKGTPVSYKVVVKKDGNENINEIKKDGKVGDYTNLSLGTLENGSYTITSYADSGKYSDAIQQNFKVVDSTVYFNNKSYFDITKSTKFKPVYSNAEITFFNKSESNFYNSLLSLRFTNGVRIDQLLSGMEARKFIKANFEPDLELWNESISNYQNYDGGIKLLQYSESDSLMTARVLLLSADYFNNESLKTYFYNILNNSESDLHSVINAYTGLAILKEPVLLNIYEMLQNQDLTKTDIILLALGLEALGDQSKASEYEKELTDNVFDSKGDVLLSDSDGENYMSAALLSTLSAKLGDYKNGDKLFDYIYKSPSNFEIAYLEELTYLKNRNIMSSEEIKSLSGSVTLEYSGKKETLDIFGFNTKTITVTPEELSTLKINNTKSDMGAYVYALGGVEDLKENRVDKYKISKEYSVNGELKKEFNQSDLIKVTITPTIIEDNNGSYQITEFIPAGFRFMSIQSNTGWYEQQEQKVIFYYYENYESETNKPITYFMQAVMPGTYTADHTVITRIGEVGVNYTEQEVLKIK